MPRLGSLRVICSFLILGAAEQTSAQEEDWIGRGRYLVKMSGCNECHTEGYARSLGKVPESEWMTGRAWGEKGPWGITFPTNVRMWLSEVNEAQWLERVRNIPSRPPMPWYNLRVMTDDDLRSVFRFIKSLGPSGNSVPTYLPPGEETGLPHVVFPTSAPQPPRLGATASAKVEQSTDPLVHRGRYLVQVAWCNSCHTEGYGVQNGNVPEDDWLLGSTLGRNGAWGTTYASNLRLSMNDFTEEQWVDRARSLRTRPVMPWFALNEMDEVDLRAIYRYVRVLGAGGIPAPSYVPPDVQPSGAYVVFPRPPKK